jgi:hypothetical protein
MSTAEHFPIHELPRVLLANAARRGALRDYLLRLGADAELAGDGDIRVHTMPEDVEPEELEIWIASWNSVNGEEARVVRAAARVSMRLVTAPMPPRLGDLLVSKGWITPAQLDDALAESRSTKTLLGRVLLRRRWIFEEELARTLAEQWSVPYVSIMRIGVDASVARLLPDEIGLQFGAIPVRMQECGVQVAFADPSDRDALDAVQKYVASVALAVAELSDIEAAWRSLRRA